MALIGDSSAPGGSIHEFYLPKGAPRRPAVDYSEGIFHYSGGRKLLDASSGPVVSNIGHGNKRVIAAMVNQAQRSAFATYRNFESEPNVELANLVCKLAGPGFDRAFFVSGGSEAIEAAIKLVRQYFFTIGQPSKWKIISRNPSYHGGTLGALSLTGDPAVDKIHGPILIKWPKVPTPFNYRVPGGKSVDEYEEECARALEDTIVAEGPDTVMAFILEPVGGLATGALVASERYMNRVREICTKYGVLLIYDEVMSGSGRTGKFFAAEHWPNARPDIIVAAKGLAAGYVPFGACIAPDWIVRPVADNGGFSHGHTYTSTPLQCAVALAVVREVLENNLIDNAAKMGALLKAEMEKVKAKHRVIGDVRGLGLLMAVEIVKDKDTKEMFELGQAIDPLYRFQEIAEDNGLLLYVRRTAGGIFGNWVMLSPPLTITEGEVTELVRLFDLSTSLLEKELEAQKML